MAELTLIIANKNYSSWSLRAWLAPRKAGLSDRRWRQDGAGEPRPGLGGTDGRAGEQDGAHRPARVA